jgi:hypothetical protein
MKTIRILILGLLWVYMVSIHLIRDYRSPKLVKHDDGIYIQFSGKDYARITSVEIVGK